MKRSGTICFCSHVPPIERTRQARLKIPICSSTSRYIYRILHIFMLVTSTVRRSPPKPGWQTDELEDEWIESFSSNNNENICIVNPLSIISHGRFDDVSPKDPMLSPAATPPSPTGPGTFLIREDQLAAPILPKPLLKGKSKGLLKDFFSPLALETMFEPPSPRQNELRPAPSPLDNTVPVGDEEQELDLELATVDGSVDEGLGDSNMEETRSVSTPDRGDNEGGDHEQFKGEDVIMASDIPNLSSFDGRKPSTSYKFTFSAACLTAANRTPNSSPLLVKHAPLSQFQAPPTDPRLRLFQFQYDTFTRDHLSAMVDSIAVHTPSDSSKHGSPESVLTGVHSHSPLSAQEAPNAYVRATKRLKLTPPEDNDNVLRSKARKDYVGESKSLMRMIKQARTPSMMTTVSAKENIKPTNTENYETVEGRPRRVPFGDSKCSFLMAFHPDS
jgi:protein NUD1